jgi:hypothetical protein
VQGVQEQFTFHRHALGTCPPLCLGHADDHFAAGGSSAGVGLEWERENVRRPGDVHESPVQFRHPPVTHEREREVAQGRAEDRVCGTKVPAEEWDVARSR